MVSPFRRVQRRMKCHRKMHKIAQDAKREEDSRKQEDTGLRSGNFKYDSSVDSTQIYLFRVFVSSPTPHASTQLQFLHHISIGATIVCIGSSSNKAIMSTYQHGGTRVFGKWLSFTGLYCMVCGVSSLWSSSRISSALDIEIMMTNLLWIDGSTGICFDCTKASFILAHPHLFLSH